MSERDPFDGLVITRKDGLPKDKAEESVVESTLISAGLTSKYSALKRLLDGDAAAAQKELKRIQEEQLEDALGSAATAEGQTPPADDFDMSKHLLAHLRGAQGGGTNLPEEGGPKPK